MISFAVPITIRNSRIPQIGKRDIILKNRFKTCGFNIRSSEQVRGYDEPRHSTFVKSIHRKIGLQKLTNLEQLEHYEI